MQISTQLRPTYLRPIRYCADRAKVAKPAANTMSGPSADSFQRALRSFKQSISQQTPELLSKFEIGSLDDLQNHCMQIQNKMGQNGEMRRMRRLQGFIEAMSQLGQSIEVFVNANELVCFIWVGFSRTPIVHTGFLLLAIHVCLLSIECADLCAYELARAR